MRLPGRVPTKVPMRNAKQKLIPLLRPAYVFRGCFGRGNLRLEAERVGRSRCSPTLEVQALSFAKPNRQTN